MCILIFNCALWGFRLHTCVYPYVWMHHSTLISRNSINKSYVFQATLLLWLLQPKRLMASDVSWGLPDILTTLSRYGKHCQDNTENPPPRALSFGTLEQTYSLFTGQEVGVLWELWFDSCFHLVWRCLVGRRNGEVETTCLHQEEVRKCVSSKQLCRKWQRKTRSSSLSTGRWFFINCRYHVSMYLLLSCRAGFLDPG